jgi:hypothetical protein
MQFKYHCQQPDFRDGWQAAQPRQQGAPCNRSDEQTAKAHL